MRFMRLLRFLTVWLLLLPVVMATAETVEQGQDGAFARVADLREGERYVYDVIVTSERSGLDLLVEKHITIEVGHIVPHTAEDGTTFQVLPISTTYRGSLDDLDALRDPDRDTTRKETYLVDVESGKTVESIALWRGVATEQVDGAYEATRGESNQRHFGPGTGPAFDWGMLPGQRLVDPTSFWFRSLATALSIESPELERGVIEDIPVLNIQQWARNEPKVTHQASTYCSLQYPEIGVSGGTDLHQLVQGRAVWAHQQARAWVAMDRALPVMQECRNVLRLGNADGQPIEDLRLATVLSDYQRGGRSVPIRFEPYESLEMEGPDAHLAVETDLIGLVNDGRLELPLGLAEAVARLHHAQEPFVQEWFERRGEDAWVHSAKYEYKAVAHEDQEAFIDVPMPSLPFDPFADDDDPVATTYAQWSLDLQDDEAGALRATVSRTFDQHGAPMEESVRGDEGLARPPWQVPDRASLVPLHVLLGNHAAIFGSDASTWLRTPGAGIEIMKAADEYIVAFPEVRPSGNGSAYRANDGLRTGVWTYDQHIESTNGPAGGPTIATSGDAGHLIPVVDRSTAAAAGAGILTFLFLLIYLWDIIYHFLLHSVAAPLYAKVSRDKALDNPRREEIHTLVQAEPGLSVAEIRKRLALGHGTTMFHLATLEHVGLLSSVRVGRARQWFAPGQADHSVRERVAVMRHAAVRRVHDAIVSNPGIHQRALADTLGIRPASLRPHLARLESVGLVSASTEGQTKRYHAAPPPTERSHRAWSRVETSA